MYNRFTVRQILFLIALGASVSGFRASASSDNCENLLKPTDRKGLFEVITSRFLPLLEWDEETKTQLHEFPSKQGMIAELLNHAITPVLETFLSSAGQYSSDDILLKAKEILRDQPSRTSDYHDFVHYDTFQDELAADKDRNTPLRISIDTHKDEILWRTTRGISANAHRIYKMYPEELVLADQYVSLANGDKSDLVTIGRLGPLMGAVVTPIGEYGEDFSRKRQITTRILMSWAVENLHSISAEVYAGVPELLYERVARVRRALYSEYSTYEVGLVANMTESILSLNQMISILLAKKIPGIESPTAALEVLIHGGSSKAGLISEATSRVNLGIAGPFGVMGVHFHEPAVILDSNGQAKLNPSFQMFLKKSKTRQGVCPFAALFRGAGNDGKPLPTPEKTGIQKLAEAYLRVFKTLEAGSL